MSKYEEQLSGPEAERAMKKITRRSFVVAGVAAAAAVGGWRWLKTRPDEGGIPWPLRRALRFNESLVSRLYDPGRLAPAIDAPPGALPRANGDLGIRRFIDLEAWTLQVANVALAAEPITLTLADIRRLPRTESSTYLYCIEGWSDPGRWAGARLSDFMAAYPPRTRSGRPADFYKHPEDLPRYISFQTPDRGYYVGLDMASALHPQTLLCYEMGGQPLTQKHGAPLRLYTPVKYGIKNLKRIGRIAYMNDRPPDYWAERGYDYWAGL